MDWIGLDCFVRIKLRGSVRLVFSVRVCKTIHGEMCETRYEAKTMLTTIRYAIKLIIITWNKRNVHR